MFPLRLVPECGSGGPRGTGRFPDVHDVGQRHEDVVAVAEQPQCRGTGPGGRHQLAVIDPRAVRKGDADLAALEPVKVVGHRSVLLRLRTAFCFTPGWGPAAPGSFVSPFLRGSEGSGRRLRSTAASARPS